MASIIVDLQRILEGKPVGRPSGFPSDAEVEKRVISAVKDTELGKRAHSESHSETRKPKFGSNIIYLAMVCATVLCAAVVVVMTQMQQPHEKENDLLNQPEPADSSSPGLTKLAMGLTVSRMQRIDQGNGMVEFRFDDRLDDAKIAGRGGHDGIQKARGRIKVAVPVLFQFTAGMLPVSYLRDFGPEDIKYLIANDLSNADDWTELFANASKWYVLNRLDFRNCRVNSAWILPLDSLKRIESLEFRDCIWQPQNIAGLKVFSRLKFFALEMGAVVADSSNLDVPRLLNDLSQSPNLQQLILDFRNNNIDEKSFRKLLALKHLESLKLLGCKWSAERFNLINRLPHLHELCIRSGDFSDDQLSALSASKTLQKISVQSSDGKFDHKMPELRNASGDPIVFVPVK